MAQELVLIPKEEYESLLTEKEINDDTNKPSKDHQPAKKQDNNKSNTDFSIIKEHGDELNSETYPTTESETRKMTGKGKQYVKQSIGDFMNRVTPYMNSGKKRKKKKKVSVSSKKLKKSVSLTEQLIKHRWLPYKRH